MDKSRLVYGIDLGTTYSCVAQVDKYDQPVVQRNSEGDVITPSVVYIDGDSVVVGKEAKSLSAEEPEKTVAFIKREIGVDESFEKPTRFPNGMDPVEISSLILKKLVKDANALSDNPEEVKDVVITCPAYFGTKERAQTKQAGEMAGLNVLAILNEPTAAAISYGMRVDERKVVMVFDLGGGTFDVTIIRVDGGIIKVIATGGDHKLGGYDWDRVISEYILDAYNQEHGTDYTLKSDPCLTNALLLEAEQKKKTLTAKDKVMASITYNGVTTRIGLTRSMFDELTETLLNQTIYKLKEVIEIAHQKGFDKIDEVLLVGGSSRMPQIKARIDAELGVKARLDDPDECVAKGAAVFAVNEAYGQAVADWENDQTGSVEKPKPMGISSGKSIRIVNVTSKTYGTDISGNRVNNLIFANSALPIKVEDEFVTVDNNQDSVSMKIYESDVTDPEKDRIIEDSSAILLEDKVLKLKKGYQKGTPVNVSFEIDAEGILSVHAEVAHEDPLDFTLRINGVRDAREMKMAKDKIDGMNVE
jgi:Molecular chaperone